MALRIKKLLVGQWPAMAPEGGIFPQPMWDEMRGLFKGERSRFLVAEDAERPERILGCGGFSEVDGRVCEIHRLVVGPAFQRQGVGQRLLTYLMKEAKELGYEGMRVRVPAGVGELAAFYMRYGFREVFPQGAGGGGEFRFLELDLGEIELVRTS